VYQGDLLTDLPALAGRAPSGATLVIYHSAVLAYVAPEQRGHFAATVRGLDADWLSNEAPGILPGIAVPQHDSESFVLVLDGTQALALTDGHGTRIDWLS
jgi:hypothetical protein